MNDKLLEVSMMLGDAIKKLDNLSAYKPDPYAHLKEAQERGEVIQWLNDFDLWVDTKTPIRTCRKSYPPDRYRIKPKEKKKLYLFAYSYVDKGRVMQSTLFYKDIDDFKNDNYKFSLCNIKRIDKSMIEVDA
jgi:hypothetical protein